MGATGVSVRTRSEDLYQAIFDYSLTGMAIIEEDGTISLANTPFGRAIGYSREDIEGKMNWKALVLPEDLEKLNERHRARMKDPNSAPVEYECRIKRKDGTVMYGLIRLGMIPGTRRTIFSGMDVTRQRRAEAALRESENRFRSAFDASMIGMALAGLDGRLLKVNQSLCDSVGYSADELLTKALQDITHPDDLENDHEHIRRLVDDEIPHYHIDKRYCHRDGYIVWVLLCVSLVRDARGYPLYFVSQIEDITERKFLEEKLQTALITDELTGLYNRKGFFELSLERLNAASKMEETCTLFLVKLDDMKLVNKTLGQKEGDAVIIAVGRMLQETFDARDLLGRIGGAEFAVLAAGTANGLATRLEHTIAKLENPGGRSCPISASVRSVRYRPDEPRSIGQLIAHVDEAILRKERRRLRTT